MCCSYDAACEHGVCIGGECKEIEERPDRSVVEVVELQHEAGSDVVLDSLQAVRWSDGSVTIRGSGHKQVGTPAQYIGLCIFRRRLIEPLSLMKEG